MTEVSLADIRSALDWHAPSCGDGIDNTEPSWSYVEAGMPTQHNLDHRMIWFCIASYCLAISLSSQIAFPILSLHPLRISSPPHHALSFNRMAHAHVT